MYYIHVFDINVYFIFRVTTENHRNIRLDIASSPEACEFFDTTQLSTVIY